MELKAGQLTKDTGNMLRRIGLVTEYISHLLHHGMTKGYERLGKLN